MTAAATISKGGPAPRSSATAATEAAGRPAGAARVITDEDLRALSVPQRRALARRLAELAGSDPLRETDRGSDTARRRRIVVVAAGMLSLALVAWALQLGANLPSRYLVGHWDLAWVGFDIMLAACIAATGVSTWRANRAWPALSLAAAVMLLCDAWFDVATSNTAAELWASLTTAALVELPLAALAAGLAYRQAAQRIRVREALVDDGTDGH